MINDFRGAHAFLSNFYPHPIEYKGQIYPTNEHLFQALKASTEEGRESIRIANTPREAKYLGRQIEMRPDWDEYRLHAMRTAIELKFPCKDSLMTLMLQSTHPHALVEANGWGDVFWGVRADTQPLPCNRTEGQRQKDEWSAGYGQNWLGLLLMARRGELMDYATFTSFEAEDEPS